MTSSSFQPTVKNEAPTSHASDEASGQASFSCDSLYAELSLPYRPSPEEPVSILPGDQDSGLPTTLVECRKGPILDQPGTFSKTTVEQNINNHRFSLTLRYREPVGESPSLEARLSRDGVPFSTPPVPGVSRALDFPFILREDQTILAPGEDLKILTEEMIQVFRTRGPRAVTALVESIIDNEQLESLTAQPNFSENALEVNIMDFSFHCSSRIVALPAPPSISVHSSGFRELHLRFQASRGPSMDIYLEKLAETDNPKDDQYFVRELQISRPGDGFLAALRVLGSDERYRIPGDGWCLFGANMDLEKSVLGEMILQYHHMAGHYWLGQKAPMTAYLQPLQSYRLIPMNIYTAICGFFSKRQTNPLEQDTVFQPS